GPAAPVGARITASPPTPSASIDTPTLVISSHQTTNSVPARSTCAALVATSAPSGILDSGGGSHGYPQLHANRRRRMRRGDLKPEPRAVGDARGQGNPHVVRVKRLAGAGTAIALVAPRAAAAAAARARAPHRHLERNDQAAARLGRRQPQFGREHRRPGFFAEKRLAHALDGLPD